MSSKKNEPVDDTTKNDDRSTAETLTKTDAADKDEAQTQAEATETTDGAPAPVSTEATEEAIENVHPVEVAEQSFSDVSERIEGDTAGLTRAADQTLRTPDDKTAWAPPGTYQAAANGVQQDASGHFESVNKTRSSASGSRI